MSSETVLADDASPVVDHDRREADFAMRGKFLADRLVPDGLSTHDVRTGVIITAGKTILRNHTASSFVNMVSLR